MKKSLFYLFAILVLSMLASSVVIAEPTHPNEIGLYLTYDGLGATGTFEFQVPVIVYLVLTRPTDTETGTPYDTINAFECQLNFNPNPLGKLFKLADVFPGDNVNVGDNSDINQGFLEYIVGFAEDVPVVDESVVLITFHFFHYAPGVIEVTLGPVSDPFIQGQMAFNSAHPFDMRVMYSMGGSHDAPVFLFEGEAVAVENESFGSVKALYR